MNRNFSQNLSAWANGRTGRFIIVQAVHTMITVAVIATLFFGAARVGALSGFLTPAASPASSLTTINYQGRLADAGGTPINNTNPGLGMTFALYTLQAGGTAVWSETQANVPVANGLFSVRLGSINALSTNLLSSDLWLGIQVGTDPEMTPREKLAAVPYAMQASIALTVPDGVIGASQIANGAVSKSKLAADVKLTSVKTGQAAGDLNTLGWGLHQGTGVRTYTTHITFDAPFVNAPSVQVSLAHFDLSNAVGERLTVYTQNTTNQGFDLVFFTWSDTVVFGASAMWLAIGTQ